MVASRPMGLLLVRQPAVDEKRLAGHEVAGWREKVGHETDDVGWKAGPRHHLAGNDRGDGPIGLARIVDLSENLTEGDRVDRYAAARQLARHRTRHAHKRRL